ncbi:ATP-binding protein [Erysipelothrix rhusiopathiae]|nr:ATP-binding protein [Erysipelothrix rhusiopathiae]
MYVKRNLLQTIKQIYQNKRNDYEIQTTQETLAYEKMYSSGVMKLSGDKYSKTLEFSDISYQLAQDDEKRRLFSLYCALLNSLDPSVEAQLNLINNKSSMKEETRQVVSRDDEFALHRKEYFDFISDQKEKGNNGIIRHKYLTLTIKESNYKNALRKLEAIETQVRDLFKGLGAVTEPLNGVEKLELLNRIFNYNQRGYLPLYRLDNEIFSKEQDKDYLAPVSFDFHADSSMTSFTVNKKHGATLYFNIVASELSDRVLVDFLEEEKELLVSLHMKPVDQQKAIRMIKIKNSDLKATKIEENKKALSRGYDMDIMPGDLNQNIDETAKIVSDLQKENERFFYLTFTVTVFEDTNQELEDSIFTLKSLAQKHNCELISLKYQQEKAFMSALPLGNNLNEEEYERGLTTTSTAVFIPFTTIELYQEDNSPVYYGLNALSNNLIQVSRKSLRNPNGLMLGTPGSGKSFSAKREMLDVFLNTNDDIIITDPEDEYAPFVKHLKGQVINISIDSNVYINPLDISQEYGEGNDPVSYKADFVLSMMNSIVGTKEGLSGKEKTLIDRAVRTIYRPYLDSPTEENIPILEDLYNTLRSYDDLEAKNLADSLELYVTGSQNVFNHRTNVNHRNRLICFSIRDLGSTLRDLGMLILQDHVWNKVSSNQKKDVSTWYYMDEFHVLLKDELTAQYSVDFWKRFRKYGGVPTGMTQNVKDLLQTPAIETILENSDFIYLLNQAPGDRKILQEKLGMSDYETNFITNSEAGEGILIYGGIILPFKDKFPKNNSLYPVMTTDPDEIRELRGVAGEK